MRPLALVAVMGSLLCATAVVLLLIVKGRRIPVTKPVANTQEANPKPLSIAARKSPHRSKMACIMYSVWHDNCHAGGSHLQTGPVPTNQWGWWGVPQAAKGSISNYRFMRANNPELPNHLIIDRHVDLLNQMDIDFVYLDLSNGEQQVIGNGAKAFCRRLSQLVKRGIGIPKVTFFLKGPSSIQWAQSTFYGGSYSDKIFATINGKKLLLVGANPLFGTGGAAAWSDAKFEYRRIWGIGALPKSWSFKERPGANSKAFSVGGQPEQNAAIAAVQSSYMVQNGSIGPGATGRNGGQTLKQSFQAAKASGARIISLGTFNEWCAQNFGSPGSPTFTDVWKDEYSADLEPVQGSFGKKYFLMAKQLIADWKNT